MVLFSSPNEFFGVALELLGTEVVTSFAPGRKEGRGAIRRKLDISLLSSQKWFLIAFSLPRGLFGVALELLGTEVVASFDRCSKDGRGAIRRKLENYLLSSQKWFLIVFIFPKWRPLAIPKLLRTEAVASFHARSKDRRGAILRKLGIPLLSSQK